jgi:peptidoglycan/LPS O-acetylase OafA/YrhL
MEPASETRIIRPLTGLRGLTILSVISLHLRDVFLALLPALQPYVILSLRIAFRMDLFFMLSGFILSYIYIGRQQQMNLRAYLSFLWARVIRIYPGHLATLLLLIVAVVVGRRFNIVEHAEYFPATAIPLQLTLTQAWPFASWAKLTWNYPLWFLSALWFGYLAVFPCVWKLAPKFRRSRFLVLLMFMPLFLWLALDDYESLKEFQIVLRVACEFLSGAMLYLLCARGSRFVSFAQRHLDKVSPLFLILPVIISTVPNPGTVGLINDVLVLSIPFLLAGLTQESSLTSRLLATRPILWLGKISYALFVTHALALKFMNTVLSAQRFTNSPPHVRYFVLGLYLLAVLACGIALHKLVEVPCRDLLRKLSAKSQAKPAPREMVPV